MAFLCAGLMTCEMAGAVGVGVACQTQDRGRKRKEKREQEEREKGEKSRKKESQKEENGQKWCVLSDIMALELGKRLEGMTSEDTCSRPQNC